MGEAEPLCISERDAEALLQLNAIRAGFCQRVPDGIKLAQHCGIVRLPDCMLEILPKVGFHSEDDVDAKERMRARAALLTMLHHAPSIKLDTPGPASQKAVTSPLLDVFVEHFLQLALAQARQGLLCRYVPHADDLTTLRGRFDVPMHWKRNVARPHLLHCQYDEFTPDNPYNQAVRAALEACYSWIRSGSTQRLWSETYFRYAGISSQPMTAKAVALLPRERTVRRYESLLTWCEWLLALSSPSLITGQAPAPGLLFDMNKLFEAHVGFLLEKQCGNEKVVRRQGPEKYLAYQDQENVFLLKPDFTIGRAAGAEERGRGRVECIVDAKWKRLNPAAEDWGVDGGDIYQMLAYAIRYECEELELAYPDVTAGLFPLPVPPQFYIPLQGDGAGRNIRIKVTLIPVAEPASVTPAEEWKADVFE